MGNSWQSPVAGEPSLGTPHPHYKELVAGADPSGTGYTSVDVSGEVPVGATQIYIMLSALGTGAGQEARAFTDSTPTPANASVVAIIQVSGVYGNGTGLVRLASNRTFVYQATNANISSVYIRMFEYWI